MSFSSEEAELLALWQRSKMGDQHSFNNLMLKVYKAMFNYGTKFTKDRELIKDCIQNLFTDLWQKRSRLNDIKFVKIYLFTSLRNNLIRSLNSSRGFDYKDVSSETPVVSDEKNIEWCIVSGEIDSEIEKNLKSAIKNLSNRQQEVVFLKFYEGLSNEEIAQVMGIGRQPVANLIQKALNHLKKSFSYKHIFSLVFLLFN